MAVIRPGSVGKSVPTTVMVLPPAPEGWYAAGQALPVTRSAPGVVMPVRNAAGENRTRLRSPGASRRVG